jgi:hypothetical protein
MANNIDILPGRVALKQQALFSWKGKTFNQITSSLQKNTFTLNPRDIRSIFHPTPLKLYRKEIASKPFTTKSSRISSTLSSFEIPNGYLISNNKSDTNGNCIAENNIVDQIDMNVLNSKYETGGSVQLSAKPLICFSQADNARRRVRSGGAAMKQYDITNRKKNYYTSKQQHLYDRNLTYHQNQFKYAVADSLECDAPTVKPNNPRFKTQGGVTASDLTTRIKYEEITNAANAAKNVYGAATADALAYGIRDSSYTIKDTIGYPVTKTPVIDKYTGKIKQCIKPQIHTV